MLGDRWKARQQIRAARMAGQEIDQEATQERDRLVDPDLVKERKQDAGFGTTLWEDTK